MKIKRIKKSHVIMYKDEYWGVQYEDGHFTSKEYGPIENADHVEIEYCKKPEYNTWPNSHEVEDLKKGKLVPVTITTTYNIGD